MITMKKRLLALGVAAGLLMGCLPGALGAEENETQKLENTYTNVEEATGAIPGGAESTSTNVEAEILTRGEARDILLSAADDYAALTPEELLQGDEKGELHLDRELTRAEAMVMLERAFGGFEAPVGANARMAFPAETFTDVPGWAQNRLGQTLAAGIVAGTGEGLLSPETPVTRGELETLIRRAYAYQGTNLKDDFYAAVNRDWLETAAIPDGQMINGVLYGLMYEVDDQIAGLITDIASQPQKAGTAEAKIAALYHTVMDTEGREKAGVEPIQPWLEAIDKAGTVAELVQVDADMRREMGFMTLLGFSLTLDLKDSSRYTAYFSTWSAMMDKDFYANPDEGTTGAYLDYLTRLLVLGGESEEAARADAQRVYDMEKVLTAASLDVQDRGNVDLIYNVYDLEGLKEVFPGVDLEEVYAATGLKMEEVIGVSDVGAMKAAAGYFTPEHLADLKAMSKLGLLLMVGSTLSQEFQEADYAFTKALYGVEGRQTTEQVAAGQVQGMLSDYLARAYAETYFTPEAKADVEEMIAEFIAIYKERIQAQDWMSEETKAMALKKLDTMQVKVGYPDSWETCLDDADIKGPEEGGSFFSNMIAIQKAQWAEVLSWQGGTVDRSQWIMAPYTVNACYTASFNDITFPAAILQAPMYDVNASREENLGGIGYVIAHEITHAFDNNGAKFDEKGNAADWWTAEDYAAFQTKCEAVKGWYDGQESAPGITCSGTLTLSENVADLGALQCIVEAAGKLEEPDYEALFRSVARTWASTATRGMLERLAVGDVHAADKLRVNRALQTMDLFYEVFDIREGDGMWTEPESRVKVW